MSEQNFSILFDEERNYVEIKYQGVNAQILAQLELDFEELQENIGTVLDGVNGDVGALEIQVASLVVQMNALTETLEEEAATRFENDTALGAAVVAGDTTLSDDIQATAELFAAGLLAEAAARNAAIEDATAIIITDQEALAVTVSGLATDMGAAQAAIIEVNIALSSEIEARSTQYSAITADFADTNAAVLEESVARAGADTALASQITIVEASIDLKNSTFYQSTAPTTGMIEGDLWFDTDDSNHPYRYSGSAWVDVSPPGSGIITYYQASAPSSGMTTGSLWFDSDDNNKEYRYNGTSWAAVDDGRITTIAASVTTEATARIAADGSISAKYSIKVDANGHVAGFGLISEDNDDVSHSSFIINADEFRIYDGSSALAPFIVTGGVVYMQNIVVTNANIQNLTVDKLTDTSGAYSPYTAFGWCRAHWNGSGVSLISQKNFASVSRTSQGIYFFTFTVAAPNADYIVQLNSNKEGDITDGNICCIGSQATTGFTVFFRGSGGSLRDPDTCNIVVFTG